jgi:hypothetical protein
MYINGRKVSEITARKASFSSADNQRILVYFRLGGKISDSLELSVKDCQTLSEFFSAIVADGKVNDLSVNV